MRVDYLTAIGRGPEASDDYRVLIADAVAEAAALERGPFTAIWFGEHHFEESGRDVIPNPVLMAAFVAARPERIRLGIGAASLPTWHPVRLAEDISMLDHFSGGRVDCGLSRGINPVENVSLNPAADRRDPETSWRLWTESVELFQRALADDALAFEGEFYRLPGRDLMRRHREGEPIDPRRTGPNAECLAVTALPKPRQSPLPLFSTTESAGGVEHAADSGLAVITWYPTGPKLDELIAAYRARAGDRARPVALLRPFLLAETDAEARRLAERTAVRMAKSIQGSRGPAVWAGDAAATDDGRETLPLYDYLMSQNQLLVGSPATVVERIRSLRERHGVEHLLLWGNLDNDLDTRLRSIELFTSEVAPALGLTGEGR